MSSCGTIGSHSQGIGFSSSLLQQTNTSGYEVRPKMEVVKPKMRGALTGDAAVDNNQSNRPVLQAPLSNVDIQEQSLNCVEKHSEVPEKHSFDQALIGSSIASEDEAFQLVNQTAHADGNNSLPFSAPTTLPLPASMGLPKPAAPNYVDYWNGQGGAVVIPDNSRPHTVQSTYIHATGSMTFHGPHSDGGSTDYWIHDEKELKRQKRKEANRESARRSRMRKQAECDDLAEKVQAIAAENDSLKMEVERLNELCQKLSAENLSLLEQLKKRTH